MALAYDLGPPFGLPLRFFQTAVFFLLAAAGLGLAQPDWLHDRWSAATLALTHLVALGFLATVMLGALMQMLPVVLGMPVPGVRRHGWLGLFGLTAGTLSLAVGFLLGQPFAFQAALAALTLGLAPLLGAIALTLARTVASPGIAWPIRLAVAALVVTVALGAFLAGAMAGLWPPGDLVRLVNLHAAWGLAGWVLVLVVGLAYQVVPMLQLTPVYPIWLTRWLTWLLIAGLLVMSVWTQAWASLPLSVSAIVFVVATLNLQGRRRRKIGDVTLDFWRLGMVALLISALGLPLLPWLPDSAGISLGIVFLLGFAVSVAVGMLYKIVPFLAWFHLKTQTLAPVGTVPNIKEMVPESSARLHFRLHLATLCLLVPAPMLPGAAARVVGAGGMLLLAMGAVRLALNLNRVNVLFLRHGGSLNPRSGAAGGAI